MTTQFVTRDGAGLREPAGKYSTITVEGITLHYGGPSPWTVRNPAGWNHQRCASIWRAWQDYHMGGHGWIDIAYTSGCCPHGVRYEGRGKGHRTAANGTNEANSRSLACVYIAGQGDPLTDEAKLGFLDESDRLAALILWDHRSWFGTECPGTPLSLWRQARCPRPGFLVPAPQPPPILPPPIATSRTFTLEELDMAKITRTAYPVPALADGSGYWDLDGAPGRPRVAAGRCISVEINGGEQAGSKDFPHVAEPKDWAGFTRIMLGGFEKGAKPTLIVTSIAD